jgi:hypothetical protein
MRHISPFVLIILFACAKTEPVHIRTDLFGEGEVRGKLSCEPLSEASGLAASRVNPGYLWSHNDSEHPAEVYLLDSTARCVMRVTLKGIENRDWEDMAIGPGPDSTTHYIYAGDIGDNDARYEVKSIYRFPEPAYTPGRSDTLLTPETLRFVLPDGKRDIETLMVDPWTRNIYLVSKREENVNLYRLSYPQRTTGVMTAEKVASKLNFALRGEAKGYNAAYFSQVVGGDISEDGTEVLIKTYSNVYYWKRKPLESIEELLKRTPDILPYTPESRGEAIAFMSTRGFATLSEQVEEGEYPALLFYRRK